MTTENEEWGPGDIIMHEDDKDLVKILFKLNGHSDRICAVWMTLEKRAFCGGKEYENINKLKEDNFRYIKVGSITGAMAESLEELFIKKYREGNG